MSMKIQFYILGFSLFFLNGCFFDTNEINNSNNKSNIDPSVSAENTNIKPMKSDYKQFFILAKDVRFDPNLAQLEAIFQGNLTLHNNCLSIIVRGDRETMHTLVIPKQYEVFFDNYNKVIGLKNIKSKELYRLGESLQFSGIAFDDEKMKLGEKLPDFCPPRFALPGSIEKLKK